MKLMKQLVIMLLCLTFFPYLPLNVQAAESEIVASGTCGENLTWELIDDTLTISGSGEMEDYSWNGAPWVEYREDIKSIYIREGITYIGEYAFGYCYSLTEIELPDSVASIGGHVFEFCRSLKKVAIPREITTIPEWAFNSCERLEEIELPNSVTNIGIGAFSSCNMITDDMLYNLLSVVEEVEERAFQFCNGLENIVITNNITHLGEGVFRCCENVQSITVDAANPYYNAEDNILIDRSKKILLQCAATKEGSCTLPNGVERVGYSAFEACSLLTQITIPSGVKEIGEYAFYNCYGIEKVELPETVSEIGKFAFQSCTNLKSINIPSQLTKIADFTFSETGLTEIEISKNVTSLGYRAFYDTLITEITIPKEVTDIRAQSLGYRVTYEEKEWGETVVVDDYIIYGYTGSAAETYAKNNNITFIALPDEETEVTLEIAISCYGAAEDTLTLEITSEDGSLSSSMMLPGNATICRSQFAPGAYTVKVSQKNHVTRTCTVDIDGSDAQLEVELQLTGDVTGDGTINARDKKLIYNHMAGTSVLTDYTFLVGDVTNDSVINARDKKLIYNHISGTFSLWE